MDQNYIITCSREILLIFSSIKISFLCTRIEKELKNYNIQKYNCNVFYYYCQIVKNHVCRFNPLRRSNCNITHHVAYQTLKNCHLRLSSLNSQAARECTLSDYKTSFARRGLPVFLLRQSLTHTNYQHQTEERIT